MTQTDRPRFAAISEAVPAALLIWRLGSRLLAQAGENRAARRWAHLGAGAAGVTALAVMFVGVIVSLREGQAADRHLEERLEDELTDSFPASDAPAITRRSY
jgi:hypothetical protein